MRIFTKPPAIIKFFADFSNFCLADFLLEANFWPFVQLLNYVNTEVGDSYYLPPLIGDFAKNRKKNGNSSIGVNILGWGGRRVGL